MKLTYKHIILFIFLCGNVFISKNADAQGWDWMKGAHNGKSHGERVATDIYENVYAAGMFLGAIKFGFQLFTRCFLFFKKVYTLSIPSQIPIRNLQLAISHHTLGFFPESRDEFQVAKSFDTLK